LFLTDRQAIHVVFLVECVFCHRTQEKAGLIQFRCRHSLTAHAGIYAIIILLFNLIASGQQGKINWNQFRGPNGQGVAQADRIPVHFSPDSNVLWKTVIPPGHSSPVTWNKRIFLTASEPANKKELVTLAIDREDGTILWRRVVQTETEVRFHPLNNPASSTPAADERHVYVYFGAYGLLCYDHAGKPIWQRRLDTPLPALDRPSQAVSSTHERLNLRRLIQDLHAHEQMYLTPCKRCKQGLRLVARALYTILSDASRAQLGRIANRRLRKQIIDGVQEHEFAVCSEVIRAICNGILPTRTGDEEHTRTTGELTGAGIKLLAGFPGRNPDESLAVPGQYGPIAGIGHILDEVDLQVIDLCSGRTFVCAAGSCGLTVRARTPWRFEERACIDAAGAGP